MHEVDAQTFYEAPLIATLVVVGGEDEWTIDVREIDRGADMQTLYSVGETQWRLRNGQREVGRLHRSWLHETADEAMKDALAKAGWLHRVVA